MQYAQAQAPQSHHHQPQYAQQAPQPSPGVDLVLNDHNAGMEVTDQDAVQTLTINGHNNQVAVQECVGIPCILANGHNNFVYSELSHQAAGNFEMFGCIERLVVQGHNNRFENLIAKEIEIFGHNNQLSDIYCQNLVDQGQNNKFRNLYQIQNAPTQQPASS